MARTRVAAGVVLLAAAFLVFGGGIPAIASDAGAAESNVSRRLTGDPARSPSEQPPDAGQLQKSRPVKKLAVEKPPQPRKTTARKPKRAGTRQVHPWSIQVGSYAVKKDAEAMAKELKDKGYDSYVAAAEVRGKKRYRVRVGHLASKDEAERLKKKLISMEGVKQALITNRK